jgi:hypothetical protein
MESFAEKHCTDVCWREHSKARGGRLMVWVQFHDALRKGRKRALSRATRFIYMELSQDARPGRGVIELRADVSIAAAVHDLIGGDRKEIDKAMPALMAEQPEEDRAMIEIEEGPGWRRLVVVAWESWNTVDVSTERVRKHREEKKRARRERSETRFSNEGNVTETVTQPDGTNTKKTREEIQNKNLSSALSCLQSGDGQ